MLVLARRVNERIVIPCIDASVQVLSVQNGQIRLGVEAPPEVAVFREEIYKGREAAGAALPSASGLDAEARLARVRHVLRRRLSEVALGLDRLHERLGAKPEAGTATTLDEVRAEFEEFAATLSALLDGEDERLLPEPAACAQL